MLGGYSEIKLTRLAFLGRWLCLFRHAIPLVSDSQHEFRPTNGCMALEANEALTTLHILHMKEGLLQYMHDKNDPSGCDRSFRG
jgi:hypothetical protein